MKTQQTNKKPIQQNQQHAHIPASQLAQIKASFDLFDTDHGGSIDTKQLKQAMISLGFTTRNNSIFQMISDLDSDGNGIISFDEWVGLMTNKVGQVQTREHFSKVFRLFDSDGSGFICANRLKEVAGQLGEEVEEKEIVQMLKRADLDVDGLISEEEFYAIMTRGVKE